VEDAIRVAKDTGMRSMPFAHNQAWLEVSLIAQVILRWNALLYLTGELALAEPKRVRQRLLHVAGRIVRSARRTTLRLPRTWPWADALAAAFARLRALPAAASLTDRPPSFRRERPRPAPNAREGEATGEERPGRVPLNHPRAITPPQPANYTCRGENGRSGLVGLLDMAVISSTRWCRPAPSPREV
jgi:hypothetical protein